MPGIPEPGLFRCARLPLLPPPPPPALLPAPRPPRCGRRDSGTKGLGLAGGASLPPWKASCSLHCSPAHGPTLCLPNLPHPSLEAAAPNPQSFILVAGDGQGLKPPSSTRAFKVKVLVAQSLTTICDPIDCSQPGSSVHGISQARIMEWVAIPSPGHLPDSGIKLESPAF